MLLLNLPKVQQGVASFVSNQLSELLHGEVQIGHLELGMLNRLVLTDVSIHNPSGEEVLSASKLSVKVEILPLFRNEVTIQSIQLFGLQLNLKEERPGENANYQFLVDALSSSDTTQTESPALRINALLVRQGNIRYEVASVPTTPERLNLSHLNISDFRANISLKALNSDSLNVTVRQLSFQEQSGLHLQNFSFKLTANANEALLSRFSVEMPQSKILLDTLSVHYTGYGTDSLRITHFRGGTSKTFITPEDWRFLNPDLGKIEETLYLQAQAEGSDRQIDLHHLTLYTDHKGILAETDGTLILPQDSTQTLELAPVQSHIQITTSGMHLIQKVLNGGDEAETSPILSRLGNVDLQVLAEGPINNLQTRATLHTQPGTLNAQLNIDHRSSLRFYRGTLSSNELSLNKLLGDERWGNTSFDLHIDGQLGDDNYPDGLVQGEISTLEYNGYPYQHIMLDGLSSKGGYDGTLTLDDPNGHILVNGKFNGTLPIPEFHLSAQIKDFRPHKLGLTKEYEGTDFSVNLHANFTGDKPDNLEGSISLDSLLMIAPTDYYFLEQLQIKAEQSNNLKHVSICSDFMQGSIDGKINFETLGRSVAKVLHPYIPSLISAPSSTRIKEYETNSLEFNLAIQNLDIASKLFHFPLELNSPSTLKGYLNESTQKLRVEGYFPHFIYDGEPYESGMLLCENPGESIRAHLRATKGMQEDAKLNLSLKAVAKNDSLMTTISWGNNTGVTYSGKVRARTLFQKAQEKAPLQAEVKIEPGQIIMNDTIWQLHESSIRIDSGKVSINRFLFEHDDQRLAITGALTDQVEDSLFVDLNKIQLEYVFDILRFHPVDFKGIATGRAYLSQLSSDPQMKANLLVENFTFNNGRMGDMLITGEWDADRGIHLVADMRDGEEIRTQVDGFVSPKEDALDLMITAQNTNLAFLNEYLGGIFKEVSGRGSGLVHLHGPFDELNLEGDALVNGKLDIEILNTAYELRDDSVHLRYNQILLDRIALYDKDGNRALANGFIHHDHLGDLSYNIRIDLNKFLVYNGKPDYESTFYGTVYGSGIATLQGDSDVLNVGLNFRTDEKTTFVYNSALPEELTSNEFITFVDKTPKRETDDRKYDYKKKVTMEEEKEIPMDIRINVQVETTPEAEIRVIMDPVSGDYVLTRGNGNLRANYYNKGDFKMYGIYNLTYGVYKLSLQEVIRKDFQLTPGGTVSFNGNPAEGNLNLQAVYTINSASLNDLAPNAGFTQSSVRVNCLMNLTGQLFSPEIKFSLDIPTISDEEMELVHSYVSTDEQMEMQIIYLLGIGRFYTYDYASSSGTDTEQSSAMNSLLSSTLSGQLNNMLSHVINSNNWNFGTNFSTGTRGWTDMEVEGILSSRLLNNRLLINGNFGYRDNPLANTNFIGDFDVQWLLTPSGEISLKGYNQTNDRYFAKATLTTQGVGLIWKKDFDSWWSLFKRKKKKP